MSAKKKGARILGPYKQRSGWLVIEIGHDDSRESVVFETEQRAEKYIEIARAELASRDHTTHSVLDQYKAKLALDGARGDRAAKAGSIATTIHAIKAFFPEPLLLTLLSAKRCEKLYEDLRTRPTERTGKPMAVDTHRNILSQTKTFLSWCVEQKWLAENPLVNVRGRGQRRPRGLSLGKAGNELHIRETRAWFEMALYKAHHDDEGAIAALVALLLGMRASEIVSRKVGDLDTTVQPCDTLWITCAKTAAGRRTLEVPEVLRVLLAKLTEGKARDRYVFEAEDGKAHWRDWPRKNIKRLCKLASVPEVTAHAMRGQLATIAAERGLAGHLIADTMGHDDYARVTDRAYVAPGATAAGINRRGLVVLNGGVQVPAKTAK